MIFTGEVEGKIVTYHGDRLTVEEACEQFEVHPVIERCGSWVITALGIECLASRYPIEWDRVGQDFWLGHMRMKNWVNMQDFERVLTRAREVRERSKRLTHRGEPLRAFLCHGREDKPAARKLYNRLFIEGVQPWLDEVDLLPGQDWKLEITNAVRRSDVVLICLSRSSVTRAGFIQKEITYALDAADEKPEGAIYIIPIRLEECTIPERLSGRQWLDLYGEGSFDRLLKSLYQCYENKQATKP